MEEGKGKHFDPLFYDLFFESLDAFRVISEENP